MNENHGAYVSLGSKIEAEFGSGRAMPAEEDWNKRVKEKMAAQAAMAGCLLQSPSQSIQSSKRGVFSSLETMARDIEMLEELVMALSERLRPILLTAPADPERSACEASQEMGEVATLIFNYAKRITEANTRIGFILARLEI